MGAIQSSIGGVVGAAMSAAKKTSEAVEAPKADAVKQPTQRNKVIDKAMEANRIAMMHTEARITQTQAFKERLEAVRTGNWKASRTKLKRRGK